MFSGGTEGWMRRPFSFLSLCIFGIVNPHAKAVQQWNKCLEISCWVAISVDPLFFFWRSIQEENKCITFDGAMAISFALVRSITDFIYFLHMLLQFRLAYVAPESRVVGAGELVDQPKKIALHYLYGSFVVDVFVVLPLPQIMIYFVSRGLYDYVNYLLIANILQYLCKCYRGIHLLNVYSGSGLTLESASSNFCRNLLKCVLMGHIVGSYWYLLGLQRVGDCLRNACYASVLNHCERFRYCGHGSDIGYSDWVKWHFNISAKCFEENGSFSYGIYKQAVILTTVPSPLTRYAYSFFWGFQQISTLGGNLDGDQAPSYYLLEIFFSVIIVVIGLFVFGLIIGDVLNFSQALQRSEVVSSVNWTDIAMPFFECLKKWSYVFMFGRAT